LGDQTIKNIVLWKDSCEDFPIARQIARKKTWEKVLKAIKPVITTCKIICILTSKNEGSYNVASNTLFSQTIMQGIKRYIIQYNMTIIIMIPMGASLLSTPASINYAMDWLNDIDDYEKLDDNNFAVWQEFILHHGSDVAIESDAWLEGTLLLSMESNLWAEVESDLKSLPTNRCGALTMLHFIIKCMIIHNQEAWDTLKEYIKTFDICHLPRENIPTACLKLKAVANALGDELLSNAVCLILEGFSHASTKSFSIVCDSKIAMQSNSIYAS
jgi:hypothetical protein